jgi:DNA mismatch repair protein MutS2
MNPNNIKNATPYNIKNIDWQELIQTMMSYATSESGRVRIQKLTALPRLEDAMESMLEIDETIALISQSGRRPYMESLDLYETWIIRLKKGAVLKTVEFKDVRHFCIEALAFATELDEFLSVNKPPLKWNWISSLRQQILNATEPLSAIETIFTQDCEIRSDASEKLFQLTREKDQLWKQVHQSLDKLVKAHEMENYLQDRYVTTREGRWVIPVRGGSQHQVKGMIHGHSQSKQTVFIEPEEVVPLNNRLRQIEFEIEEEIERLLTELSSYLSGLVPDFDNTQKAMASADFRLAQAQLCVKIGAKTPVFSENIIELKDLAHPLLLFNSTENEAVVRNTVTLNNSQKSVLLQSVLLLTGPNAGGKTILLKSIGLAVEMSRSGMPICAKEGSQIPFFNKAIAAVGDSQSVDEHLSTFAAHMKILNQATELVGPQSIVLIDEICGSTDPEEGSALARSFIESFCENNIFAVVTSHLGPLKLGWQPDSKVLQGSLQYDEKTGRPTYFFMPGIAGESLALQTAKRVGVKQKILDRAYTFLTPEMRKKLSALFEIEQLKADLLTLQTDLQKRLKSAEKDRQTYEEKLKQFEREKDSKLEQLMSSMKKQIDEKIQHAKVENVFEKHKKLENIKMELPTVIKSSSSSGSQASELIAAAPQTADEFIKIYPPGTKVFVKTLGHDGIIQGEPNNRGEIPVMSQSLRLFVHWKDLQGPNKPDNPTQKILRSLKTPYFGSVKDQDRVLDVRGQMVDEALLNLEDELDQAARGGEDRIKIIHGHGTEALKRAIRAYLSRSLYVKKWKAGGPDSGGDGLTWVEIGQDS